MQFDLDDELESVGGGLARGGEFGEELAISPYQATATYLNRINPNLVVSGAMALGGIALLSWLVTGLGQANPNNQLLQSNQATTVANGAALTATTEALKTVAEQKPAYSCNALVCVMPPQAGQPAQPVQQAQPPAQSAPLYPPEQPRPYESVPTAYQPATAPNGPTSPDWWRQQWQQDPAYVQSYSQYCSDVGWSVLPECRALYQIY